MTSSKENLKKGRERNQKPNGKEASNNNGSDWFDTVRSKGSKKQDAEAKVDNLWLNKVRDKKQENDERGEASADNNVRRGRNNIEHQASSASQQQRRRKSRSPSTLSLIHI